MYGHPSHPAPALRPLVAVLALELSAGQSERVQLTPDGVFRARDGRPRDLPGWRMDPEIAGRVLARLRSRATPIVIDYEHQTLHAETNGQPAPAAGWLDPSSVEYAPGLGLTGVVQWTDRAKSMIDAAEYRFLSPVLPYDPRTGEVLDLIQVALTNYPAVDGMAAVAALSGRYDLDPPHKLENSHMDKTRLAILIGLAATAEAAAGITEDAVLEAITALKTRADASDQKDEEIAALKARPVDPRQYVPTEVVEHLKTEIAALKTASSQMEVDRLVSEALEAGKLLPAQEAWARSLGASDVVALRGYLAHTPAIAALAGQQSGGKAPQGEAGAELDDVQLAVCRQMGIDPADYKKTLAAQAQA